MHDAEFFDKLIRSVSENLKQIGDKSGEVELAIHVCVAVLAEYEKLSYQAECSE